ncbi:MAG: hypothetical protein EBU32_01770 [Opitutaceae bacterium]|nr:hypothetical protein [Opitutaceae bacterium]
MRRVVLMICDGHRADFVRPEMCPNLYNFADRARRFDHHSAIFPSATRASAASIATGCFPASHGLHGNSMGLPDKNGYLVFDVGAPSFLDEIRTRLGRTLLLSPRLMPHTTSTSFAPWKLAATSSPKNR